MISVLQLYYTFLLSLPWTYFIYIVTCNYTVLIPFFIYNHCTISEIALKHALVNLAFPRPYICLTSLTRAKWNFPLNFCTMRKLSDLYSGIFQNSLTCAKWNFPLNFRTMRKLSDLYSRIFQTQSSGCASGVDLFRNFTKLKILNI